MPPAAFIYYPSVVCQFTIRFDEALLTGSNVPAPVTPEQAAKAANSAPSTSTAKGDLLNGAKDRLTHVLSCIPTQGSVELPSYRQAPKFSLTFAFKDLPLDPRAIRAMAVEIYIGTVKSSDFARGMKGLKDNQRLASQLVPKPENLMLVGLVDNHTVTYDESGSKITVDGRGLQGLLLDKKLSTQQLISLKLNQPIDAVVRQLVNMISQGANIPVKVDASEWDSGVPKPAAPELITRVNQGATGGNANLPMQGSPGKVSCWDKITDLCYLVGAIPYFIGHELWIRPARSIYTQKNAGLTGKTPFKGGLPRTVKLTGGKSVDINFRKMIYGRNLQSFKLERKFGVNSVPVVRVHSVDTSSAAKGANRYLEAEWPPLAQQKARTTSVDPSGATSSTDPIDIPVAGVTDKTRLELIARQVWEEIGRGELGGSASSKDLASLGGDNTDADIIRLRPGDAIEILVDASGLKSIPPIVSELNQQAEKSVAEVARDIQNRLGVANDLAQVLAGTARGRFQALQNTFRIGNVRYSWDIESGIGVDFDYQNYIEARFDVQSQTASGELGDFTAAAPTSSTGAA